MNGVQELCVLLQLDWALESYVRRYNQCQRQKELEMVARETKTFATDMRSAMLMMRQRMAAVREGFSKEAGTAVENMNKVEAYTGELRDANKEMSAMLSETGSNFPTTEDSSKKSGAIADDAKPDVNGVTLNPGTQGI